MKLGLLFLPIACLTSAALANPGGEIGYPDGSLGYDALVKANYQAAERQILLDSRVSKNDPARLINLGQIYSKTGRTDMAVRVLEAAMRSEEVELILANGEVVSSRDAARRALATIRK
jgi:hypothetical protein